MVSWWESLPFLQQLFYYCAIPSTLILVIQTILSIFGIGNDDFDVDIDMDVDTDFDSDVAIADAIESAASLKFFSIRGIVAFFTLFGWVGVVLAGQGINSAVVIIIAFISGLIGMFIIALLFYSITRLQCSGNINVKNAIGQVGQVYIPIPANMSGKGKIQVTLQDTLSEIYAMTEGDERLTTGSMVLVVDEIDSNTLLVEKQI